MHTFFINTSKKNLEDYEVLFDIHYENKSLVSMNCPIADWYNEETGYLACVREMGDMIEGYRELNNAFNLILYIDLPENKAYSAIERDEYHDKAREECCRAMHILFTHVISSSIVKALADAGRKPQNVLIMFGEEKEFTQFDFLTNDPSRDKVMSYLFGFLGLPDAEKVEEIAKEMDEGNAENKMQAFWTKIKDANIPTLVPRLQEQYRKDLELWCEAIVAEGEVAKANNELFDRICNTNKNEEDRIGIEGISCRYDCYACRVNKSVLAVSQLNVALHLLRCVEANSVYEKNGKTLLPFHAYTAAEVAPLFKHKELMYADKAQEVDDLAQSYVALGLVTDELRPFDHKKFGLDSHGDKGRILVETAAAAEDEKPQQTEEEAGEEKEHVIAVKGNTREITETAAKCRTLFTAEQFKPFDYTCEADSDDMLKMGTSPSRYVEQAKKVRTHHLDYMKELRRHISGVLSNYAGKSKENKPALLQMGGYPYAAAGKETKMLEDVENTSKTAYETAVNQYMEFCAGSSVEITDVENQCNWFVSRIRQIEESIKRIGMVALGMLVAIIALYIPFLLIQFEAIALNVMTVTVALCSVAIPIVLLYLVFLFVALAQRKKYIKAWESFKEKSDAASAGNTMAAEKFDQLLSTVIPSLRWIYEYKLDVQYYAECCTVADAKVEHHRRKLHNRAAAIRNILGDLEYQEPEVPIKRNNEEEGSKAIDFNMPFCVGATNRSFYTVINSEFFEPKN